MVSIGVLVRSKCFSGIGKVVLINEETGFAEISFFESPLSPNSRIQTCLISELNLTQLHDEAVIYCKNSQSSKWQRARYGGSRPDDFHLVIYRSGEQESLDISEIYILNIANKDNIDVKAFLASRTTDSPRYSEPRSQFMSSYIKQRSACRSLSSLLSTSVELEAHQLAIVRRVLQDDNKKYLLADEVGLGKTIEAGMIIRELIIDNPDSVVIISVPDPLVEQWKNELEERFFLDALYDDTVFICSHSNISKVLLDNTPTVLVIDEAHLISPLAWSDKLTEKYKYDQIADAAKNSETCLLLSGTPLTGNENNFLSMLHLLSPESYELTDSGLQSFKTKIEERERLGGIYQSLNDSNDNFTLTDNLNLIAEMFPFDEKLNQLLDETRPLVDWSSNSSSETRTTAIKVLRQYLGENYRLHQRLLRNRREDPSVAFLFPGLDGVTREVWSIDKQSISIEQYLDGYRNEYLESGQPTQAITQDNYYSWLEDALTSPMLIGNRAKILLEQGEMMPFEVDVLESLIEFSTQEQQQKDSKLIEVIKSCINENDNNQLIVFCGENKVSMHVYQTLKNEFGNQVELHQVDSKPKFCSSPNIKVLVCDKQGEDGLNLHGGRKSVLHYSLPLSFSRIEQRLGRVNRYSADIKAYPVKSIVLLPNCESFSKAWFDLLNRDVGIFNNSVASLQYVLEEFINEAMSNLIVQGVNVLSNLSELLGGVNGQVYQERQKVIIQEQLNSMEADIEAVSIFTDSLITSDDEAESDALLMSIWIKDCLHFKKLPGEILGTFKYIYTKNTLMDINTFISDCIFGLDFENSTYKSPMTELMSFDRTICSQGQKIYPFRYGQPFIEAIYKTLLNDRRGICSARIRILQNTKLPQPVAGFKLEWLVTHQESKTTSTNQKKFDEVFPPKIDTQWYFSSGTEIDNPNIINLLEKPYESHGETKSAMYKDVNLRSERWSFIEEHFPEESWADTVNKVYENSATNLKSNYLENDSLSFECLSMSVVILYGK
ncbi:protein DpdE [Thalassotalea crassostreae]|uniref:protein DpdE n=1 Tax=Thalassotalea crassostreae TaxID=1763536 RepID=UPI000837ED4C|nr:protein DpdE [Thalassotalea crassostreae]